ncbi:class D sortase [Oceanobacillus sp. ISL-73]|uniref:class D sortase n=1 Tax=Oceanobacillus sp. ISL-73 TaxID=2819161 RepID=UPI001BE593D3|nr:class D sortase [Oceanobacillus sp. ISL-73]MBT2653231.1 class D sortase [Oceanobacillus sp. ISL-73]
MRKKRLWIGISSLVLGFSLIAIPIYYDWKTTNQNQELVEAMELVNVGSRDTNNESSTFTEEELEGVFQLEIPAINLNQYVLPKTTQENLAISLTQIVENENPKTDNISIAGHRGYRGDRHFRNLPELKQGDNIFLTDNNAKSYHYKVKEVTTIQEDAVEVLENNGPEITLITCTLDGKKRVAVKGELIE